MPLSAAYTMALALTHPGRGEGERNWEGSVEEGNADEGVGSEDRDEGVGSVHDTAERGVWSGEITTDGGVWSVSEEVKRAWPVEWSAEDIGGVWPVDGEVEVGSAELEKVGGGVWSSR